VGSTEKTICRVCARLPTSTRSIALWLGLYLNRSTFNNFEKSLLDSLSRDILAVANLSSGNLIDFIQANNALFRTCYIVVGSREQAMDAHFRVLANVPSLCEWRTVGHRKRDREHSCQCFCHQRLANTRRSKQEYV